MKEAVRTGLEPVTPCVTGMYSNQLNKRTIFYFNTLTISLDCGAKVRNILKPAIPTAKKMHFSFNFSPLAPMRGNQCPRHRIIHLQTIHLPYPLIRVRLFNLFALSEAKAKPPLQKHFQ